MKKNSTSTAKLFTLFIHKFIQIPLKIIYLKKKLKQIILGVKVFKKIAFSVKNILFSILIQTPTRFILEKIENIFQWVAALSYRKVFLDNLVLKLVKRNYSITLKVRFLLDIKAKYFLNILS